MLQLDYEEATGLSCTYRASSYMRFCWIFQSCLILTLASQLQKLAELQSCRSWLNPAMIMVTVTLAIHV